MSYTEWEKLGNISQLYGNEVPRLRIYRNIRPCNRKRPTAPHPQSDSITPYTRSSPMPAASPFSESFPGTFDFQTMMMFSQMLLAQQYYMMSCMFPPTMPR